MHREARIANTILAALAVISLTLLSLPLTGPVRTFKVCLLYVLDPAVFYGDKGLQRVADVPARVRDLVTADLENQRLRDQIKQAAWVKAEAGALALENQRLRSELGLKAAGQRQALWAHVMEREPVNWYRSFMIDAGSDQGISLNAPVLARKDDGVVAIGRVWEVRPKSSIVLLVTDERSAVAGFVTSPSTQTAVSHEGLLQGEGAAELRMNYLEPDVKIDTGDLVYTSPTSATFPPHILIGTVDKVFAQDPFLTFQSVEVKPALDAASVEEVMILKPQSTAQPVAPPEPAPSDEDAEPDPDSSAANP